MKLFRTVSDDEWNDYYSHKKFRTAKNTLEAKQFFKSETGVREYKRKADEIIFVPPYRHLLVVELDLRCLSTIPFDEQVIDDYDAITIAEDDLNNFNNCVNFVDRYDI